MRNKEETRGTNPTPEYFEKKYRKVPGAPAFPPPSLRREEEYIQKMIWKDRNNQ